MPIPQYSAVNGPFVSPDGRLTFAGNVFLRELWLRGGGSNAPSNDELLLSEYADAGIEETKATLFALADTIAAAPIQTPHAQRDDEDGQISALREELAAALKRIDALEQGFQL